MSTALHAEADNFTSHEHRIRCSQSITVEERKGTTVYIIHADTTQKLHSTTNVDTMNLTQTLSLYHPFQSIVGSEATVITPIGFASAIVTPRRGV